MESLNVTKDQRLATALRWIGSVSVIASALVFMLQGLSAISSFERFLSFGLLTLVLAAFGLISGTKMKEAKSARTFLGLAAAATPVLFSQLGAMLYANFQGYISSSLPQALLITAPSPVAIFTALGVTVSLLTPILYVGFGAFFRARASQLVVLLLVCSGSLLVPTRNPDWIAIVIFAQTALLTGYAMTSKKQIAGEVESMIAGLLPILPVAIMIGRQVFYPTSYFFASSGYLLLAGLFYEIIPSLEMKPQKMGLSRTIASLAMIGVWFELISGVLEKFSLIQSFGPILTIYPAVIALLLSPICLNQAKKSNLCGFMEWMSFCIPLYAAFKFWTFDSTLLNLIIGFSVVAMGYSQQQKAVFKSGIFTSIIGLMYCIHNSLDYLFMKPWVSLAVIGVLAIFFAAWFERNKTAFAQWRSQVSLHFTSKQVSSENFE